MNALKGLENATEIVKAASSIDEKRLKQLNQLVGNIRELVALPAAADPRVLEMILQIMKAWFAAPLENLQSGVDALDRVLKIIKTA
ncbi:MAG: hypothetical protein PHE59_05310, partial [Patescibacteria group bacterium]|nr:hypothetical protein [Patescibacteria group bacterium]